VFVVVDYEKGNIRSVQKGLEAAGAVAQISSDPAVIARARGIVLPGVGAFADAAAYMQQSGQMAAITQAIQAGVPFLGICLGLQLMFECGEEGVQTVTSRTAPDASWAAGLGVLPGYCTRIAATTPAGQQLKVPHVGWNQVHFCPGQEAALAPLLAGLDSGSNFYFTHSYQGVCANSDNLLATVEHANIFPAVVRAHNAFGVQFHPEKSSHKGLAVLRNFVNFANEVQA